MLEDLTAGETWALLQVVETARFAVHAHRHSPMDLERGLVNLETALRHLQLENRKANETYDNLSDTASSKWRGPRPLAAWFDLPKNRGRDA